VAWWKFLVGVAAGVVVGEVVWGLIEVKEVRDLYRKAQEAAAASGKPLMVVGRPDYGMSSFAGISNACGDVCLDLNDGCPTCPTSVQGSVEDLSQFPDDSHIIFLSHVLEHVRNPEQALAELQRVSGGDLFIAYPRAWTLPALLHPTHSHWMGQNVDGSWWFKKIPGREGNIASEGAVA